MVGFPSSFVRNQKRRPSEGGGDALIDYLVRDGRKISQTELERNISTPGSCRWILTNDLWYEKCKYVYKLQAVESKVTTVVLATTVLTRHEIHFSCGIKRPSFRRDLSTWAVIDQYRLCMSRGARVRILHRIEIGGALVTGKVWILDGDSIPFVGRVCSFFFAYDKRQNTLSNFVQNRPLNETDLFNVRF